MANAMKMDAGEVKRRDYYLLDPSELVVGTNSRNSPVSDEVVAERAASMLRDGQLQPISARRLPVSNKIEVYAGFTRLRAALLIQETNPEYKIRVMIESDLNDLDAFKRSVIENSERENTNLIDKAYIAHRFIENFGWDAAQVAEFLRERPARISQILKLRGLSPAAQQLVADGRLKLNPALDLLKLDAETQDDLVSLYAKSDDSEDDGNLLPVLRPTPGPTDATTPDPELEPNPEPAGGYDPMTGEPLGADGKKIKVKKPKGAKLKTSDITAAKRKKGQTVKRPMNELRLFLSTRRDNISTGIIDFLDGTISPEELASRLDDAN